MILQDMLCFSDTSLWYPWCNHNSVIRFCFNRFHSKSLLLGTPRFIESTCFERLFALGPILLRKAESVQSVSTDFPKNRTTRWKSSEIIVPVLGDGPISQEASQPRSNVRLSVEHGMEWEDRLEMIIGYVWCDVFLKFFCALPAALLLCLSYNCTRPPLYCAW